MQSELLLKAASYRTRQKRQKAWKKVVLILSSIVVFCTTYALILPAITMEPEYICGHEAHIHHEACYQIPETVPVASLVCKPSSLGVHEHTIECYDENGEPKCGIADFVLHTHNDNCFDADGELVCTLPEIKEHIHDESCWQQPHTHEEACYIQLQGELLCPMEEGAIHIHDDTCYTARQIQLCELPEEQPHIHGEDCYTQVSTQVCLLDETEDHVHTDECYQVTDTLTCERKENEGHLHTDSCFDTVQDLTCTQEADLAHIHSDACYGWAPQLTCDQLTAEEGAEPYMLCEEQEIYLHTHEASCFDTSGACVCGLLQVSEHIHGDTCFVITQEQATEPVLTCGCEEHEHAEDCIAKEETDNTLTADRLVAEGYYCGVAEHSHAIENNCFAVDGLLMCSMTEHMHTLQCTLLPADPGDCETAADWEANLPELTGEISADLIAVAQSQLGYEDSDVNYIITEDDEVLYYSRYADWWGSNPYGDWNAMFVAFCLDYADITDVPLNADVAEWPFDLDNYDQWNENTGEFQPIPADLVFFDDEEDGVADRVGIVAEVDTANGQLNVILEHRGMVQQVSYDLNDSDILGYARIPGNEPSLELLNVFNVQNVINLIDEMPSSDEIDAKLTEYEEAGNLAGQDVYFEEVCAQVCSVYAQYSMLSDEEKASVINADKLLELEYMWGNQEVASTYASSITRYNLDANNIFAIDAVLGGDAGFKDGGKSPPVVEQRDKTKSIMANANVVYIRLPLASGSTVNRSSNLGQYLLGVDYVNLENTKLPQQIFGVNMSEWYALRFEKDASTPEYPGYVVEQVASGNCGGMSNTTADGFIVMIRKSFVAEEDMYIPSGTRNALAHLNQTPLSIMAPSISNFNNVTLSYPSAWETSAQHEPLGYLTLSPVSEYGSAEARTGDMDVVDDITFKMFDYSWYINKTTVTEADSYYRPLASHFYFRGGSAVGGSRDYYLDVDRYTPGSGLDGAGLSPYDLDGFTRYHATVEPLLYNGFPVLDFSKDANGAETTVPSGFTSDDSRSLAYLFDETIADSLTDLAPGAVTQYNANNTLLQFDENTYTYWYDSAKHAVDYDIHANEFRVRPYTERNSISADWMFGDSAGYDDFLPFNYSDGIVNATYYNNSSAEQLRDSSFRMNDVNYWFGMSMEFDFIQGENGMVTYTNNRGQTKTDVMEFEFSGDDDVWVFVDDVLILDLGGTHGAVTGLIDFSTGEIKQYLDWDGKGENDTATSFPTTLASRFAAAGKTPNGGWDTDNSGRFADYSTHTLKFFYMERGTAVANCSIRFNLPNFQNPLVVGKTLEAADADVNADALEYLQENTEYSYRVVKADANSNPTSELLIQPGQLYTVLDNGLNIGTYRVGTDGFFKLKHGQQAIFENIWEIAGEAPVDFVVEEMLPETQTGHYNSVSYTLSAEEGTITDKTDNSVERFVGYYSPTLTSTKSTQIQFRNVVDTDTLSVLKVTKAVTEGSDLAEDQAYTIRVKLDGEYVAEGTKYSINGTEYTVGKNGSITLIGGQTAEFLIPVLAGTTYEVMEVAESGWVVTYTGIVTDSEGNQTTADLMDDKADTFPMAGSVHVTITNSTYVCRVPLRFTKQAVGNSGKAEFTFQITQVNETGEEVTEQAGVWNKQPTIQVSDTTQAGTTVYFVYGSTVKDGTYYYKLTETPTDGWSCDDSEYIVAIKVEAGAARITSVKKDGVDYGTDNAPQFVNYKQTSITVDKTVTGNRDVENLSKKFSFTVDVTLNDEPVILAAGEGYTVEADGTVSFTLTDGGSVTITGIPFGAEVTVTETDAPGFSPYYKLNDGSNNYESNSATVKIDKTLYKIHFFNSGGYELPETGGTGTLFFAGAILMLFPLLCIVCRKGYKGRRVTGG